jgi:hypothetical protein
LHEADWLSGSSSLELKYNIPDFDGVPAELEIGFYYFDYSKALKNPLSVRTADEEAFGAEDVNVEIQLSLDDGNDTEIVEVAKSGKVGRRPGAPLLRLAAACGDGEADPGDADGGSAGATSAESGGAGGDEGPAGLDEGDGPPNPEGLVVTAVVETEAVDSFGDGADDPAIWVNPEDPAKTWCSAATRPPAAGSTRTSSTDRCTSSWRTARSTTSISARGSRSRARRSRWSRARSAPITHS